jgi:4-methoxybenzoate monooxygenase (O-demethylating)
LHTRTRGLMNQIISPMALKALKETWSAHADELADHVAGMERFDAVAELGEAYPMRVFPDTIGLPIEGREHLLPFAAVVFNAFGPRNAIFQRGNAEAADSIAWVAEACKRRSLSPGGWGMAVYEAADRGECTEAEAELLVRSLLSAGVDTTVNGISHAVLALATHPESWDKLRDDPSLARKAFEESLRWDSTAQTFFRTTTRDVEVGDVTIPEGSKVLLFLGAANRDPRRWDDPDRYDIDRSPGGHVGFGHGIHLCLGHMVAKMEGELLLQSLARRLKSIRITGAPERRLNNTLHAISRLPVEVERAH